MLSIGEFSKATGLTVKTLRFYHEKGLLVPAGVNDQTGYRYYHPRQVERAEVIAQLRELEFPLDRIAEVLASQDDETGVLEVLEAHRANLEERLRSCQAAIRVLDTILHHEREVRKTMQTNHFEIEEKSLPPLLIGGVRMKGRYSDCGTGFQKIGRSLGRYICGPCFLLHYDSEFSETDADFEACMPLRAGAKEVEGVSVRELPGGRCLTLVHKGPYDELRRSYARIFSEVREKGLEVLLPTREVYMKGPGMIFRGNPKNYLTEIQIPIRS